MHVKTGRKPEERPAFAGTKRAVRYAIALFLTLPLVAQGAALTLAEAERLATAGEPGRLAHTARSAALAAEADAAGALPAPTLRLGLNNYPFERGDFSTEGMTNAGVVLRQAFPPGETRDLERARLGWRSDAERAQAEARRREVLLAVRRAWFDLYLALRREALLDASAPLFGDLLEVTRSLYAVGRKSQQDVLRAELELGRLEDRRLEARQAQARARAELRRWVGEAAQRPLPGTLTAPPMVPGLEVLRSALSQHPVLEAAEADLEAQRNAVSLAEQRRKPAWALDLGYSYRDGELPTGEPRSDFVTVGVSFDLPFLRRSAIDQRLAAALETRDAVAWEREALRRRLTGLLEAEYGRWTELGSRIGLFDEQILHQAAANAEAAKLAYQSDTADFSDVMRAAIDELDTRLDHLRLTVQRAQSQAALAWLGGLDHEP